MALRLLILVLLVAGVAWVLMRRAGAVPRGAGGTVRPLVQDPVCKTFVPKDTAIVLRRGDVDYYFCSNECAGRFERGERVAGHGPDGPARD